MRASDIENLPTEGERGVRGLCKLAKELGYKDHLYRMQLSADECVGDLLEMLEDNPGMIEAIHTYVLDNQNIYDLDDDDDDDDDDE